MKSSIVILTSAILNRFDLSHIGLNVWLILKEANTWNQMSQMLDYYWIQKSCFFIHSEFYKGEIYGRSLFEMVLPETSLLRAQTHLVLTDPESVIWKYLGQGILLVISPKYSSVSSSGYSWIFLVNSVKLQHGCYFRLKWTEVILNSLVQVNRQEDGNGPGPKLGRLGSIQVENFKLFNLSINIPTYKGEEIIIVPIFWNFNKKIDMNHLKQDW